MTSFYTANIFNHYKYGKSKITLSTILYSLKVIKRNNELHHHKEMFTNY